MRYRGYIPIVLTVILLIFSLTYYITKSDKFNFYGLSFSYKESENWNSLSFDDSNWDKSMEKMVYLASPQRNEIYIRQYFDSDGSPVSVRMAADDCIEEIYANGELIKKTNCSGCASCREEGYVLKPLKDGKNVIAIKLVNFGGPAWFRIATKEDLRWVLIGISFLFFVFVVYRNKLLSNIYPLVFFFILSLGFFYPVYRSPNNLGIRDWDVHLTYTFIPYMILTEYHQIPMWNPYLCGGDSIISQPESSFLSPLFIFILIFGPIVGLKVNILVHAVIGMFGMYLLSKYFRITGTSMYLPSVLYMLGGFYTLHMSEGHAVYVSIAFLPWVFLFYLKSKDKLFYMVISAFFCSLTLLGGNPYTTAYIVVFIAIYTACSVFVDFIKEKDDNIVRYAIGLVIFLIFLLLFSAIKLLPIVEHNTLQPFTQAFARGMDFNLLSNALLNREQSLYLIVGTEQTLGWWEYGAYIGWIPLILAVVGMFSRERLPLVLTALCILAILTSGHYNMNIWDNMKTIPLFSSLRTIPRLIIIFVFILAIFAGITASRVENKSRKCHFLVLILLLLVVTDLTMVNTPALYDAFPLYYPYKEYDKTNFTQARWTPIVGHAYSEMFPMLLQGKGVVNCYAPGLIGSMVFASDDSAYRGEVFVANNRGTASIMEFTPNRIKVKIKLDAPDVIVLNQNFYPGWRVSRGDVEPYNGLISAKATSDVEYLEFYYLPQSFILGTIITLTTQIITLLGIILHKVSEKYLQFKNCRSLTKS